MMSRHWCHCEESSGSQDDAAISILESNSINKLKSNPDMGKRIYDKNMQVTQKTYAYQAPSLYVFLFYLVTSAWTVVSILFLGLKYEETGKADVTQLVILAFLLGMTWYFSLGIFYRIKMEESGKIELKSFRRVIKTHAQEMSLVQGPLLPIGFLRFRLEREKVYLFCIATDQTLHQVLSFIRSKNPDIKFKSM